MSNDIPHNPPTPALPASPPPPDPGGGSGGGSGAGSGGGGIKLVAIDLDGTLLRSNKHLSTANAQAIAQATNQGIHIVLASARPPRSVRDIYHRLALDTLQVNYNGALVHDMPRGKHVFHQPMSATLAKKIVSFARKMDPNVVISIEILDKWYTDHVDDKLPTETSKHFSPDFVGPLDAFLTVPVTKLMLLAPPEKLRPIHQAVRTKFAKDIAILISDDYLIQLVHKQVDKANALQLVAKQYNVPRQQVMAIGDADNDLGMVQWAGLGVAMENGWDRLKQIADIIAPTNDDDGVAKILKKYVLNKK
jgi:5-amino-6-(5-phospho-D-ribitylamino)uracil phosphatase